MYIREGRGIVKRDWKKKKNENQKRDKSEQRDLYVNLTSSGQLE